MAGTVLYLVSDASSFVTGNVLWLMVAINNYDFKAVGVQARTARSAKGSDGS